jgi:hypothetical protein
MYDSEEPPKTVEEGINRLLESILWEVLENEMGLYKKSPFSNYPTWKDTDKKRYDKSAKKLHKVLENMMNNKPEVKIQKTNLPSTTDANNNKKKTLRDYMREYVGR